MLVRVLPFLAVFSLAAAARAADPACPEDPLVKQSRDILVSDCVAMCTHIIKNKSQKAVDHFSRTCGDYEDHKARERALSPDEKTKRRQAYNREVAGRCADKLIEDAAALKDWAVETLKKAPVLMSYAVKAPFEAGAFVADTAKKAAVTFSPENLAGAPAALAESARRHQAAFVSCEKDPACKRLAARNLLAYGRTKDDGGWAMDDQAVDAAIKDRPLDELRRVGAQQRDMRKRECERELAGVRKETVPNGGAWTAAAHRKVYDTLATREPTCPGLLGLMPDPPANAEPEEEAGPKEPGLSILEKYDAAKACVGVESTEEIGKDASAEACKGIIENLIPVPALGKVSKAMGRGAAKGTSLERTVAAGRNLEREAAGDAAAAAGAAAPKAAIPAESRAAIVARKDEVYATKEQNLAFMERVKSGEPKLVVDVENSVMKKLNEGTNDFDLVTGLTNTHKKILGGRVDELKKKYPGVRFDLYSDAKSMKIAVSETDGLSASARAELRRDLEDALKKSNAQFGREVRELGVDVKGAGEPETWFRGATGDDVDLANLGARRAREREAGTLVDTADPKFVEFNERRLREIDAERVALTKNENFEGLLDSRNGVATPKEEVFDLTRKYSNADDLAQAVRDSDLGTRNFSSNDARQLMSYAKGVDEFPPPILEAERVTPSLAGGRSGGMTVDFQGMGAANAKATAHALAGQTDLKSALKATRAGEKEVTTEFKRRMERIKSIAGDMECTGDDCSQAWKVVRGAREKIAMVDRIARDPLTKKTRLAMFAPNVPPEARRQLTSHGEALEKAFRKSLRDNGLKGKLRDMTFAMDMDTVELGKGKVNLVVGRTVNLTRAERAAVEKSFYEALQQYNAGKLTSYGAGNLMSTERRLILVPGPGLVTGGDE